MFTKNSYEYVNRAGQALSSVVKPVLLGPAQAAITAMASNEPNRSFYLPRMGVKSINGKRIYTAQELVELLNLKEFVEVASTAESKKALFCANLGMAGV